MIGLRRMFGMVALGPLLGLSVAVAADAPALNERLPADTLAFVELDPTAGKPAAADDGAVLNMSYEALQWMGALPPRISAVADALRLAAEAGRRRTCLALLDLDLKPAPIAPATATATAGTTAKRAAPHINSLQAAWIVDLGPAATSAAAAHDLIERLTSVLSHASTRSTARQSVQKTAEGHHPYVAFYDTRWPAWLKLAWAQDGNTLVLTVGDGAMAHYFSGRGPGLQPVPWSSETGTTHVLDALAAKSGSTGTPIARAYVASAAFRRRFPDAMASSRLGQFFTALGVRDADATLLSARRQGRAISLDVGQIRNGQPAVIPWTIPLPADSPLLKIIPDQATSYMALKMDWPAAYARITAMLDALLTDPGATTVSEKVAHYAARLGVDIQKDVLAKLAPIVIVHDWPPHPLRLPLMVTAIASADPIDGPAVKAALNKLLADAKASLARQGQSPGRFQLRTDPDGVMYMQYGVVGPAWTWVGDRLVWSSTPAGVRANIDAAMAAPESAFTKP